MIGLSEPSGLIYGIVCAGLCWMIAKDKNRSPWWALAGLAFGVVGILILLVSANPLEEAQMQARIELLEKKLRDADLAPQGTANRDQPHPELSQIKINDDPTDAVGEDNWTGSAPDVRDRNPESLS